MEPKRVKVIETFVATCVMPGQCEGQLIMVDGDSRLGVIALLKRKYGRTCNIVALESISLVGA